VNPLEATGKVGLVPMAVFEDPVTGVGAAKALAEGGLNLLEVTFRTKAAAQSIEAIRQEVPEMLVGAGTVLDSKLAKQAVEAGAQFIVCPGLHRDAVEYCLQEGIPVIPGALTPTELGEVLAYGLEVVKIFPAERSGGAAYLEDLSGPFYMLRFMPSGGVREANMRQYLSLPSVHALSGSWILPTKALRARDFATITRKAEEAIGIVREVRNEKREGQ
jgi:2-dehydro-3-deoxyphosphogluconate aldolase/(4S)-4-hydroxy-2-oxoglutarate aldolase